MEILSSLPAEIWACISLLLPGEQLLRLKLTGSISLWRRICDPRAVYAVNLGKDFVKFRKWPAFLDEFPQIKDLSIRTQYTDELFFWLPKLPNLPSTVRKLDIFTSKSNTLLIFLRSELRCFSIAKYLPKLEVLSLNLDWKDLMAKGATFPPTLTSLQCRNCNVAELPPTIVHLKVNGIVSVQSFGNLLNLETLIANGLDSPVPLSILPQSLRSLHIAKECYGMSLSPYIEEIPQTLTKLGEVCFPPSTASTASDLLLNLPPCLTELIVQDPPSEHLSRLPSALKTLHLKFIQSSPSSVTKALVNLVNIQKRDFKVFPISILPQSLTHLEVLCSEECYLELPLLDPLSDRCAKHAQWPPYLTFLELSGIMLSRSAIQQLPPSLKSFCVEKLHSDMFEYLPRGLTFLECFATTSTGSEYFQFLPRSLTRLKLQTCLLHHWIDHNDMEPVSVPFKHNTIHNPSMTNNGLPKNLRYLLLSDYPDLQDSLFLTDFREMEALLVVGSPNLTDAVVPLLPRHLTRLNLRQSKKITGKSFRLLPRELTHLSLNESVEIYDADIKHLPRTLQQLHLQSAVHLTDFCIVELPQHLTRLDLTSNKLITTSSYSHLPYQLRSPYASRTFSTSTWEVSLGKVEARI